MCTTWSLGNRPSDMAWRMMEKEPVMRAWEATMAARVANTSIGQKIWVGTAHRHTDRQIVRLTYG